MADERPDRLFHAVITVLAAVWRRLPRGRRRQHGEQLVAELYGRPSPVQKAAGVVRMTYVWLVRPVLRAVGLVERPNRQVKYRGRRG